MGSLLTCGFTWLASPGHRQLGQSWAGFTHLETHFVRVSEWVLLAGATHVNQIHENLRYKPAGCLSLTAWRMPPFLFMTPAAPPHSITGKPPQCTVPHVDNTVRINWVTDIWWALSRKA